MPTVPCYVSSVPTSNLDSDFTAAAEPFRRELLVHCYQMLGSVHDAQDLVQETMMRAWGAYDHYDPERASMRTWLHHIATNSCLNALESRARRPLPSGVGQAFQDPEAAFVPGLEVPWLQPIPDRVLGDVPEDPADVALERGSLRLALVAALQLLPAKQRAALILRDVLGFSASETAEALDLTTAAVNSALQRARAALANSDRDLELIRKPDRSESEVVDRYAAAFEQADVDGLARLLAEEVLLEMPPMWNWYVGPEAYRGFMARVFRMRGTDWRTVRTSANRQPAIVAYSREGERYRLHTLQVFTVEQGLVVRTTVYQVPEVFAIFELPELLDAPR